MSPESEKDLLMAGAMDFQKETARHIYEILTDKDRPHRRVLLADEVGLGKTIVAKSVVSLIREYQRTEMHDDYYRVVYVCSNINIANQNISKLGIKHKMDVSTARLSMQHLFIELNNAKARKERESSGVMPEIIIPLTPSTSFDFRSSAGIAPERALICVILSLMDEFSWHKPFLEKFFMHGVTDKAGWNYLLDRYRRLVRSLGEGYWTEMGEKVRQKGQESITQLLEYAQSGTQPDKKTAETLISELRQLFAMISVDSLEPDLVIMDEFQRFRSLITGESEQSVLAKRFFSDKNTKVLLLSATPYKPFSTLDELTESGNDDHYSDFREVVGFLNEGDEQKRDSFEESWRRFSIALSHISGETFDVVKVTKTAAEDSLYGIMCRTERFNTGGIRTVRPVLDVTKEDITSYFEARGILDELNAVAASGFRTMPIDYVKSSPYLMTFMDRYKLKGFVRDNRKKIRRKAWKHLYLPYAKVDGYKDVPCANARLQYLYDSLFSDGHSAQKLLWVPASRPFYKTHGIFSKNEGFSKTLLFSAWEMVPRMVSCMISFYSEKLVVRELISEKKKRPGDYFKDEKKKNSKRYGEDRLSQFTEGENPLCYVCKSLAEVYNPSEHLGRDIRDIINDITPKVQEMVKSIVEKYDIPVEGRAAMSSLTLLMRLLDGEALENLPDRIGEDAVENLVLAAIGSPAICGYRLYLNRELPIQDEEEDKDKTPEQCKRELGEKIGSFFVKLFNKADAAMVVDLCSHFGADNYVEAILEYCVEGNLQAVLQEYDHLLEGQWKDVLNQGPLGVNQLTVEMQDEENKTISKKMRTWMAVPFINVRMDEKVVEHTSSLRNAFNSPFRPFVLSTTSVGQEGLDFHWYARKLLHWNLPSNPVDMEQREGRVNRYKCLSIRQRLGIRYADLDTWEKIFGAAKAEYKREDSDIVPYWCLPKDFEEGRDRLVERIILEYPLSQDRGRYERLKKVLSLYRLTMGQPRQEELLEMLDSSGLNEEEIAQLMIDLSPYSRNRKK